MQANPIARRDVCYFIAGFLHPASNFMAERHGQVIDLGYSSTIVRVRVADPDCPNANQNIACSNFWDWNVFIFQQLTGLNELYCSHRPILSLVTRHLSLLFHFRAAFPSQPVGQLSSSELVTGHMSLVTV